MMANQDLVSTAKALVAKGKGILAADESFGTIKKRFDKIGVESTEDTRRSYREMLFTTPGTEAYISGVILFDETIRQNAANGTPFPKVLAEKGIIPGIKVDKGKVEIPFHEGEMVTIGLDGLGERLDEYRELGAKFAKWRAVINIGKDKPSRYAIQANAQALARYAAMCQVHGLVPIVEPEVLMDGEHSIQICEVVTTATLKTLYFELFEARVILEGSLLKPNMVLPGKNSPQQASAEEIAEATVRSLRRAVPAAVPGIVFLSGGQSAEEATERLNAMNQMGDHPWELSFSYGRALQAPSLEMWHGQSAKVPAAQNLFFHRAQMNNAARNGEYSPEMETASAV
jgi:fructose-bisphosphate aldolase class I